MECNTIQCRVTFVYMLSENIWPADELVTCYVAKKMLWHQLNNEFDVND